MYIRMIRVENIRSISSLLWRLPTKSTSAGWHVILGDNGSGKSTFLRAIALALVGPNEANALRQDWNEWLRTGQTSGLIRLSLGYDTEFDKISGRGKVAKRFLLGVGLSFLKTENEVKLIKINYRTNNPDRHVWSGKPGWFAASYGPFRRFAGGDKDYEKIFYSNPKLAAHLSVFGESVALSECIRWLQDLQFKKLEKHPEGKLLDKIITFVNQEGFFTTSSPPRKSIF